MFHREYALRDMCECACKRCACGDNATMLLAAIGIFSPQSPPVAPSKNHLSPGKVTGDGSAFIEPEGIYRVQHCEAGRGRGRGLENNKQDIRVLWAREIRRIDRGDRSTGESLRLLLLLFLVVVHSDAFRAHRLALHRVKGLSGDRFLAILQLSQFIERVCLKRRLSSCEGFSKQYTRGRKRGRTSMISTGLKVKLNNDDRRVTVSPTPTLQTKQSGCHWLFNADI